MSNLFQWCSDRIFILCELIVTAYVIFLNISMAPLHACGKNAIIKAKRFALLKAFYLYDVVVLFLCNYYELFSHRRCTEWIMETVYCFMCLMQKVPKAPNIFPCSQQNPALVSGKAFFTARETLSSSDLKLHSHSNERNMTRIVVIKGKMTSLFLYKWAFQTLQHFRKKKVFTCQRKFFVVALKLMRYENYFFPVCFRLFRFFSEQVISS